MEPAGTGCIHGWFGPCDRKHLTVHRLRCWMVWHMGRTRYGPKHPTPTLGQRLPRGITYFHAFYCIYAVIYISKLWSLLFYKTWNSFQTALDEYSKAHHVQLCCVNSRTVLLLAANKLLTSSITQHNTSIKYADIRLGCKHFGNHRKSGRGIRSNCVLCINIINCSQDFTL